MTKRANKPGAYQNLYFNRLLRDSAKAFEDLRAASVPNGYVDIGLDVDDKFYLARLVSVTRKLLSSEFSVFASKLSEEEVNRWNSYIMPSLSDYPDGLAIELVQRLAEIGTWKQYDTNNPPCNAWTEASGEFLCVVKQITIRDGCWAIIENAQILNCKCDFFLAICNRIRKKNEDDRIWRLRYSTYDCMLLLSFLDAIVVFLRTRAVQFRSKFESCLRIQGAQGVLLDAALDYFLFCLNLGIEIDGESILNVFEVLALEARSSSKESPRSTRSDDWDRVIINVQRLFKGPIDEFEPVLFDVCLAFENASMSIHERVKKAKDRVKVILQNKLD
ncbi:MAG: hypothetical protein GY845_20715 [Planctomycetes bacterium]|nr:hypothetical protein [Planctomycetota bacterium]